MPLLHLFFWLCDLLWLISLVFDGRKVAVVAVGSWIPFVCVTVLGFVALGLGVAPR